jgi:hypothetical protein
MLWQTIEAKNGDPLRRALHEEKMDCLIFDRNVGLVVWGQGDVKERIGMIHLTEFYDQIRAGYSSSPTHVEAHVERRLHNYFPTRRREILLE